MDKFLFCYKPSEINQSLGFHQFTAMGKDCRLIKSLASSDRNWKSEFIFVSGFWAGNPMDVGRDPFAPYSRDLGNLRLEGTSLPFFFFLLFIYLFFIYFYILHITCFIGVKWPSLSKFHRDRVHRARLHANRDFRSLVTLRRLAKWGLSPELSDKAIAHEVTMRRSKFSFNSHLSVLSYLLIYL